MWKFIPVFPSLGWLRNKQDFEAGLGGVSKSKGRGAECGHGKYINLD